MYFKIFLALVPMLSHASGQIFTLGHCNKNLHTVVDFNATKFNGDWYIVRMTYNHFQEDNKCFRAKFNLDARDLFSTTSTMVSELNGSSTTINYKFNYVDVNRGKFNFEPGFMMDSQPFWVIATDYDDYADIYTCVDTYFGKLQTAWIMTRTNTPSDEIVNKGMQAFKDNGIKLKMRMELQDCD